ncbi:acyl-[acyl-carrier-protein] thioesterase [Fidelibacter multiformis]|uniref:acyl-[acyl-carrier-protein] thioesterase n=1 Tax=Fidelibacter multiformis TaxID=3377529 RepID=UPI0037DCE74D
MKESYSQKTRIKSHETDYRLRLKASALLQHFQDVAVTHALLLGVGYEDMKKLGLFWVVTRFHIEIERIPVYDEEVEVLTWPKVPENRGKKSPGTKDDFVFIRDFLMNDAEGHCLVRATSSWVMLDFKQKRLQPAEKFPLKMPENRGKHALNKVPRKIPESEYPMLVYRKQVGYSDIDLNLHVNNTRYADWIMDVFSRDFLEEHTLIQLEINYLREVFWDDKIDLFKADAGQDNAFIVEGIEQRTGKASFRAFLLYV